MEIDHFFFDHLCDADSKPAMSRSHVGKFDHFCENFKGPSSVDFADVPEAPAIDTVPAFSQINPESFTLQPSQLFNASQTNLGKRNEISQPLSYMNSTVKDRGFGIFSQLESKKRRHIVTVPNVKKSKELKPHSGEADLFDISTDSTNLSFRDGIQTPKPLNVCSGINLRSVNEISEPYRRIFNFPYFNVVQSNVFDDVYYTDKPMVVCAPTGGGKTVVFELAIIRLLEGMSSRANKNFKIVYMAPMKALCSERYQDWRTKFDSFGLQCKELTGDTELDDYYELQQVNIILTTPEKWDSMTRKWRDNMSLVQTVCLFLIDEIHVLNDGIRGATIEAVVSRMKTIQAARHRSITGTDVPDLRFIAVSATIPNTEDVAEWLGTSKEKAAYVKMDDSFRPVRLRKVVLGFNCGEKSNEFGFDLSLSYKLPGIINTYSDNKPTLVFCSTRKSTQQAAEILAKDARHMFVHTGNHRQLLQKISAKIKDGKLRDTVLHGIGFHHAGMDIEDRKYMEKLFSKSELPVLVATSTLAMGVNLPAHLVIIKSTMYYNTGRHMEYSKTQVLQMIGRAGRPQFDTSATAVILTKNQTKWEYEALLNGTQCIESSLHKNLIEHLNAEIVLHTINDMSIAMEWIRYTFLYIRVMKNPSHYGMPLGLTKEEAERRLQDLCMKNLNMLSLYNLITMNEETFDVKATETGRLMARYFIAFETIKKFTGILGKESLSELLNIVVCSEEFSDIQLRVTEKKILNTLNKDKNRLTVRYQIPGKIKTKEMKVNCLIQAHMGSLLIQDFALQQDCIRIFRAAQRVTRCLVELLWLKDDYKALCSSIQLSKCIRAKLWEDSKHIAKQVEGIGPALSNALVNAGKTSFQKIEETNPREIELICNRHPPFGNQVREHIAGLPKYELAVEQVARYCDSKAELTITLTLANRDHLLDKGATANQHMCILLIGDADNRIVFRRRIMDMVLLKESQWTRKIDVQKAVKGPDLFVNLISQDWVGLDVESKYTPHYVGARRISTVERDFFEEERTSVPANYHTISLSGTENDVLDGEVGRGPCSHKCAHKRICGHDCCKNGVLRKQARQTQNRSKASSTLNSFVKDLKHKIVDLPHMPMAKRIAISETNKNKTEFNLDQFSYIPRTKGFLWPPLTHVLESEQKSIPVSQKYDSWSNLDLFQTSRGAASTGSVAGGCIAAGQQMFTKPTDAHESEYDLSFSDENEDTASDFGNFCVQSSCCPAIEKDNTNSAPCKSLNRLDRSNVSLQSLTSKPLSQMETNCSTLNHQYKRSLFPHKSLNARDTYIDIDADDQLPVLTMKEKYIPLNLIRKLSNQEPSSHLQQLKWQETSRDLKRNPGTSHQKGDHKYGEVIAWVTNSQGKSPGQCSDGESDDWTDGDTTESNPEKEKNIHISERHCLTNREMNDTRKVFALPSSNSRSEENAMTLDPGRRTMPELERCKTGHQTKDLIQMNAECNSGFNRLMEKYKASDTTKLPEKSENPSLSTFFIQKDNSKSSPGINSPQKTFNSIFDGIF